MSTAIATEARYTPEDLLAMPDGKSYELVNGELVEHEMGIESSWVAIRIASRIDQLCEENQVGWVLGSEAGYQCFPHDPGRVRKPDVSFIRYGRLPGGILPKGWAKIRPDLAVEVVSPNDLVDELDEKLADYEMAGVPLVWVVSLVSRQVMVYRADGTINRLREDDELSGEDVIPGFRCRVRDILPKREPSAEAPSNPNGAGANG
jgi:Uma2 family endonuclease